MATKANAVKKPVVKEVVKEAKPVEAKPVEVEEVVAKPVQPAKVVAPLSPEQSQRQEDRQEIQRLNKDFARRLASDPKTPITGNKYFAEVLGKIYPFALNAHTFVIRFDGTVQYFPETITNYLRDKLGRIMDGSAPKDKIDNL